MPAVTVLHGRAGIYPAWEAFAKILSENGYLALVLDYFVETGHPENLAGMRQHWSRWTETIHRAVEYVEALPGVRDGGVGVVGFSLGGYLAISTAGSTPSIKVIVEYYGGGTSRLEAYAANLPPVLILHGESDSRVPVAKAHELHDALQSRRKTVEIKIYPNVEQCFDCSVRHWRVYDPAAAEDAEKRALNFLNSYLRQRSPHSRRKSESSAATVGSSHW